jgi:hypothetical protein
METNRIHYHCGECGRAWTRAYQVEILSPGEARLSRIVTLGSPGSDAFCICGSTAVARLETSMQGYQRVAVCLLARVPDVPRYRLQKQEQYEELINHFIEQEQPITWEQIGTIEEKAGRLLDLGLTPARWKALSPAAQAQALKLRP